MTAVREKAGNHQECLFMFVKSLGRVQEDYPRTVCLEISVGGIHGQSKVDFGYGSICQFAATYLCKSQIDVCNFVQV